MSLGLQHRGRHGAQAVRRDAQPAVAAPTKGRSQFLQQRGIGVAVMQEAALARLCDPASQVSAHYLIARDGEVFALVDEGDRAWHAGVSAWQGIRDINSASVGIELDHPGHDVGGQMTAYPR